MYKKIIRSTLHNSSISFIKINRICLILFLIELLIGINTILKYESFAIVKLLML